MWFDTLTTFVKRVHKIYIPAVVAVISAFLSIVISPALFAADYTIQGGASAARGTNQPASLFGTAGIFTTIVNILLFIIGALAVIMLIYGGLRYTISGGNDKAVTSAKNTILYAIVGLIVAVLAYAIINFVLTTLAPDSGNMPTTT